MEVRTADIKKLGDPNEDGLLKIPGYIPEEDLEKIWVELEDPEKVQWTKVDSSHVNKRKLKVVEKYDQYALKLSMGMGTTEPLQRIPEIRKAAHKIGGTVSKLWEEFATLALWQPDELILQRYHKEDSQLTRHKDLERFVGVIAIAALEGECDLAVYKENGQETLYKTEPGDLILLRATGLNRYEEDDLRPDHAVVNLRSNIRTSMSLRDNNLRHEPVPGIKYANWDPFGTPI